MRKMILSILFSICVLTLFAQTKQKFDLKASVLRGQEIYVSYCISCHMESGEGIEGVYPPLAKSDYLMADKKRTVAQVLHGLSGEIKVNGKTYNNVMTGFDLTDQEVSDVINYIRNSWGNKSEALRPEEVTPLRK